MPPVGFEPTISAGERPQTYAFDRAAKPHEIQVEIQASLSTHRTGCMPQEVPEALGYSYVVQPA